MQWPELVSNTFLLLVFPFLKECFIKLLIKKQRLKLTLVIVLKYQFLSQQLLSIVSVELNVFFPI